MLKPLADRIVAKPLEAESQTKGGILLPDSSKEKTQTAEVLAIGKEVLDIDVGDLVVYDEFEAKKFKHGSDKLLIIKEEDVLAVVEED